MKKDNKESQFAWPSQITASVIKLDLIIQCKNLPKKDTLSQADAFCVLWKVPNGYSATDVKGMPSPTPGRPEQDLGRTEIARGCMDPTFKHTFRLEYSFEEEQSYIIRVYDEDLRYATDLNEHDYLGGCIFSLGQLMGAKGCSIARPLKKGKSYIILTGNETIETCEILDFRLSCQDLVKDQSLYEQSKVLDKCNPYFRLERLKKEDQSWDVVWKSEVVKKNLCPTWGEARLPIQLLCNGDQNNPLKITIWDWDKEFREYDYMGFVESTVSELTSMAKEGIPVFSIRKEKKKLFGMRGTKLKTVGLLKVLKASVITVPSMLQYVGGGCSLDLIVGIDCTLNNGVLGSEKNLHYSASQWQNDYQAGIQKLGTLIENFARGNHSSIWGFGAKVKGKSTDVHIMEESLCSSKELLFSYDKHVTHNRNFRLGRNARLKPLIEAAMFQTIQSAKRRQCYTILTIFTAGNIIDLEETVPLICTAAEDAPISIVMVGMGNGDFSALERLCSPKTRLKDARGIPIARDVLNFVSFRECEGNASKVIAHALKNIPEQFVTYFVSNGISPRPPVPPPDFEFMAKRKQEIDKMSRAPRRSRSNGTKGSKGSRDSGARPKSRAINKTAAR